MTLESFVQEAIHALGYLRPEACAAVAGAMERRAGRHAREIGAEIRSEAPQLSADEKNRLRLGADVCMSRAAWEMLTAKGRKHPIAALDTTILRANFTCLRERSLMFVEQHEGYTAKAFGVVSGCPGCKEFNRREMTPEDARKHLPPTDCANEACGITVLAWRDVVLG